MNDQEMNVAIAEIIPNWAHHHGGRYCSIANCENKTLAGRLFSCTEDLNSAMVAVRYIGNHLMTPKQWKEFGRLLHQAGAPQISIDQNWAIDYGDLATIIATLTPKQICEALLQALKSANPPPQ